MSESRRRFQRYITVAALLAAFAAAIATSLAQSPNGKWWPGYGNGPDNSRYFASEQIKKSNVSQLQVAWNYPYGDTSFGPVVVRGVIYGRGRNGSLVAVDAKTGKELWIRENMNGMTSRGMNYWESSDGRDQRLIFAMNSLLQELDAKTGKSIMTFGTNGYVDLRIGIDGRDPSTIGNIQSNTPGEVFENLIILGSATGEGYMSPPGDIRAYDVLDGKLVWTFHTVPRPGEFGYDTWPKDAWKTANGANAWSGLSLDPERGIVYLPLASAGMGFKDFYGADREGNTLFDTSLVALDANTGKRLWHHQFVEHDVWDRDPPTPPTLVTVRRDGRDIPAVAQIMKYGFVWVFDRVTGENLFPVQEVSVFPSTIPGEKLATRQTLPAAPEPFARQRLTEETLTQRTPAANAAVRAHLATLSNRGRFDPPSLEGTVIFPGLDGGGEYGGAAWDPETGILYINSNEQAYILQLRAQVKKTGGEASAAEIYNASCAGCHGVDRKGNPPRRSPHCLD